MKRLFATFTILLALPLIFAGVASASEHFWRVEMSDPTTSDQQRTFNIEFTALSVEQDTITVDLVESNEEGTGVIDSATTAAGGGSGSFNVTVDEDGVYSYWLSSTSSLDSAATPPRTTAVRSVRVVTPPDQETVIIVDPELTPEEEQILIEQQQAAAAGGGAGEVEGATGDAGDGEDATADGTDGTVSDEAATDVDEDGEVLGAEDEAGGDDGANTAAWIAGAALLLGALYYFVFYRNGVVNPFSRTEE